MLIEKINLISLCDPPAEIEALIKGLAKIIKPLVCEEKGTYEEFGTSSNSYRETIYPTNEFYHIKETNLFDIAYTWNPNKTRKVKPNEFSPVCDIVTYHPWAYYGFFKPTIAEVLYQIPQGLTNIVSAFCIIESPDNSEDLNRYKHVVNQGYHRAITRLFRNNG